MLGSRGRQILRPAWSTEQVSGQSGLQREPVFKKKKKRKKKGLIYVPVPDSISKQLLKNSPLTIEIQSSSQESITADNLTFGIVLINQLY